MASGNSKKLIFSIIEQLQALKSSAVDGENVDVACQCIATAFGADVSSTDEFKANSFYPRELNEIFNAGVSTLGLQSYEDNSKLCQSNPKFAAFMQMLTNRHFFDGAEVGSLEYLKRHAKALAKFNEKMNNTSDDKAEKEKLAEQKKADGNAAIQKKEYENAARLYTEALELSKDGPNSHIYYSNRAAAYCHLGKHDEAISDCQSSIALVPDYVKAYSRLGLAYFFLEQYEDALDAYTKASELEPTNTSHKDSIRQTNQKIAEKKRVSANNSTPGGSGGAPDLSSLAGMLGGAGGGGGLGALLQNPAMMQMAQEMMKNPAMMQQAMSMLGGGRGAGAGGMPDLSALAGLMGGGANGGGGGGGGGGIPSFSGFAGDETSSASTPSPPAESKENELMQKLQRTSEFQSMQNDPAFQTISMMINAGNISGAMQEAQKNPAIMQKMMSAMQKCT